MSRTTSATAHPAVPTPVTSRSFASSGGGGEGRAACSRVGLVALQHESSQATTGPPTVMYLVHAPGLPDEGNR